MAYQSLYRRYRPRRFSEIRGQSHVVTALRNAVRNNTVSHAYLFSGPRGTGKTSTARILAKALNCENPQDGEPCCECGSCTDMEAGRSFDLFELDAASNNGVDAIRDLVDRAAVGSPGRTKVYILDEVHMLSTAASNALLKTLEEPPGHVRFVLATTDPQKVLPTIKSRTQHYEFQLLGASELEDYVRWIISDADLTVDDEAVRWSVRQGKGSARDTLSALDQVVAAGGVVERVEPVDALLAAMADADPGAAIQAVADALNLGHDPRVLGRALLDSLRDLFLLSLDAPVPHLVPEDVARLTEWATRLGTPMLTRSMDVIGNSLVEMRNAADPRIPLEVALIKLTRTDADSLDGLLARIEKLEAALAADGGAGGTGGERAGGGSGRGPGAAHRARGQADGSGPAAGRSTGPAQGSAVAPAPVASAPVPPAPVPPSAAKPAGDPPVPPSSAAGAPPPAPAPVPPVPAAADSTNSNEPSPAAAPAAAPAPAPAAADSPAPAAAPAAAPAPAPSADAAPAGTMTVESLNSTLMDKVVPAMKGVAKAIYSQGRFISVDGDTAVYLVENAPTKDRAEKAREQVEQQLGRHLGMALSIRIVDSPGSGAPRGRSGRSGPPAGPPIPTPGREPNDQGGPGSHRPPGTPTATAVTDGQPGGAPAAPSVPAVPPVPSTPPVLSAPRVPSPPAPAPKVPAPPVPVSPAPAPSAEEPPPDEPPPDDDLYMDIHELEDATDVATTGLERLLEAFPGAQVIERDTQDTEVR